VTIADDIATKYEKDYRDMQAEIERLMARLEMWPVDPKTGEFDKSIELDVETDGIACRDETIRQQDERISALTAEVSRFERLFKAAKAIRATNGVGHIEDDVWYEFAMAVDLLCSDSASDSQNTNNDAHTNDDDVNNPQCIHCGSEDFINWTEDNRPICMPCMNYGAPVVDELKPLPAFTDEVVEGFLDLIDSDESDQNHE